MARLIPVKLPEGTPYSERRVHQAAAPLSDDWTIIHSVRWQSFRNGRQGDGEADFVFVHPNRGILIVEVKGGGVSVNQGQWSSINSQTGEVSAIKDPFQQATESKHALLAYLKDHGVPTQSIAMAHAVAFPSITVTADFGAGAPSEIVWDRPSLEHIEVALEATCKHWQMKAVMTAVEHKELIRLLAPTLVARRRLVDVIGDVEQRLIQLTDEQVQDFALLRSFRRAIVLGGAGTGKTVLAVTRARQLALDGFKPLLVCYNERLGQHLEQDVADQPAIYAGTFHRLCMHAARNAGIQVPSEPNDDWWMHTAPEVLIDASAAGSTEFDAVVVDEGQDFPRNWLDALGLVVENAKDAPFYVFADEHQQLYLDGWSAPDDMPPPLALTVNCRSSTSIATRAAMVFGEQARGRGTEGPAPQYRDVHGRRETMRAVQRLVEGLIDDGGLPASSITVLCDSEDVLDALGLVSAGSAPFTRAGTGVRMETIRRFKGLESEVIILVLSEAAGEALAPLAYTGISRARSALYVLGPAELRKKIGWIG